MERQAWFRVKVEYLSAEGPAFKIVHIMAHTKWHAIELVYSANMTLQPNRSMYEIYTQAKSDEILAMKRCAQTLAGYAHCYAMTYN